MGISASAVVGRQFSVSAVVTKAQDVSATVDRGGNYTYFDGEYTYTPNGDTQTVPISGKIARSDIVINPIPSNYGLITYNGVYITVS